MQFLWEVVLLERPTYSSRSTKTTVDYVMMDLAAVTLMPSFMTISERKTLLAAKPSEGEDVLEKMDWERREIVSKWQRLKIE